MFGFITSTAAKFGDWVFPGVMEGDRVSQCILENADIDPAVKKAFLEWSEEARGHHEQISSAIKTAYGLPELEALRAENCNAILFGQWQSSICLTNMLLEGFLKLALVYSNGTSADEHAPPLTRIQESHATSRDRYTQMNLSDTINVACKQGLIDKDTKDILDDCRKHFRNAFFHMDSRSMFGEQSIRATGIDVGTRQVESSEVPIHSLTMAMGEAVWQNAKSNAIPYFLYVDSLIRKTLPKVFPDAFGSAESPDDEDLFGDQ